MRSLKNVLVTGGAGFIGSNFIKYLFEGTDFSGRVVNLDKLTYAGNPLNLTEIEKKYSKDNDLRYVFVKGDICNSDTVEKVFSEYDIDTVIHFAAESHVDRSIHGPQEFVQTNVVGTVTLLEMARKFWADRSDVLFHHVSTDEVYGSLGPEGSFSEITAYDPRSPYSASKASSDHFVSAYNHTFGLPVTISNCSNNYGPYQFPEKLIPLMIRKLQEKKSLPVYGDGKNIRDWLYVEDHNRAVWEIMKAGKIGETYNIGGENEWENITLVQELCKLMAHVTGEPPQEYLDLITFVTDRPGHDKRYAINCEKIKRELGWEQQVSFRQGLERTIHWYLSNKDWVAQIESGEYRNWLQTNYEYR